MTSLSLDRIKRILLRQQREVKEELQRIDQDDPILTDGLPESQESGSVSWMADVHTRTVVLKDSLMDLLNKTQKSLMRLNRGSYGRCERCGKMIEEDRLKAMPTATLCIVCSRKKLDKPVRKFVSKPKKGSKRR